MATQLEQAQRGQRKAFRIPQNRNFLISGELVTSGQPQELLQALPPLSRFLLVLHTVGGYNQQQLATAFKLDAKTVAIAHFTSDEDPAATATPTTTDEDASATETATSDETTDTYTPAALESGVTYTAQIEVEDYGTITVELDQEAAQPTDDNGTISAEDQPVITSITILTDQ